MWRDKKVLLGRIYVFLVGDNRILIIFIFMLIRVDKIFRKVNYLWW